jgi:hypothetical protein
LAKQFQRKFVLQWPIRNKNCSWQPCLLAKRNETKKLYRGPYIDAFCQDWLHAVSEEKIFLAVANQKQELLLAAIFVGQTNETKKFIEDLT